MIHIYNLTIYKIRANERESSLLGLLQRVQPNFNKVDLRFIFQLAY